MLIDFEEEVESKVTKFRIDPKTFITRVGGVVGVWKNLLWVLIFCFVSLNKVISILTK